MDSIQTSFIRSKNETFWLVQFFLHFIIQFHFVF